MTNTTAGTDRPNSQQRQPGLTQQAKGVAQDLKSKAGEIADSVTETAKEQASDIGAAASQMAGVAREKVEAAASHQKSRGADYIGAIAGAMHRAAGEFQSDVPQAAHYIRQASEQINGFADSVRQRDMRDLVGEVQEFARRQPTLFFGGAVMLGFAALRFLKSATPPVAPDRANAFEQRREGAGHQTYGQHSAGHQTPGHQTPARDAARRDTPGRESFGG